MVAQRPTLKSWRWRDQAEAQRICQRLRLAVGSACTVARVQQVLEDETAGLLRELWGQEAEMAVLLSVSVDTEIRTWAKRELWRVRHKISFAKRTQRVARLGKRAQMQAKVPSRLRDPDTERQEEHAQWPEMLHRFGR